jgi:adenylate cyclase class 2
MPLEIEAKLAVPSFDDVRARLAEHGATRAGSCLETNTFFDTDDRSLLAADEGLRLRQRRDDTGGQTSCVITFKGPRQHGKLKTREEVELRVSDQLGARESAVQLLRCLGFSQVLSFEKRRESWKLDGCSVELDEMPRLGTFVEIEGPGEAQVLKVRDMLGLADRALVRASYVALLMTYLQERGSSERFIRFDPSGA